MDNPIEFILILLLEIAMLVVVGIICIVEPSVHAWLTLVLVAISLIYICYIKWYWR